VLKRAEAIVGEAQEEPHRALQFTILAILWEAYPGPVSLRELATRLGRRPEDTLMLCHALKVLHTIERVPGGFRYRPPVTRTGGRLAMR
jgi:DNA-binding IclR family transcriptional regulator